MLSDWKVILYLGMIDFVIQTPKLNEKLYVFYTSGIFMEVRLESDFSRRFEPRNFLGIT